MTDAAARGLFAPTKDDGRMNKQDLIRAVAEQTGFDRSDAARLVEAILGKISQTLASGSEVRLARFGRFYVGERKASLGRNPRTGAPLNISTIRRPKFRPAQGLKGLIK
ncbi:HU family DNA-binding protein [Sphingomonas sp. BIUV-7]|uniref:HU family DNA-binding protein n=1 Tax=Sphingomonas natans TaxID=3063330 RepID=A0ABT8Y773_9SPHN|nr:HU family DNA-binding protein [Sphingomonas sp. BIUV-7]MDO6414168.1 HU family DNA-binding protein [Sphingomonas sp. BIUV-7]